MDLVGVMVGCSNSGDGRLVVVGERGVADCYLRCEILSNSGGVGDVGE